MDLVENLFELTIDMFVKTNRILGHLEGYHRRFWKIDPAVKLTSQDSKIIRFGSTILAVEVIHIHQRLFEHGWWF